MLLSAKSRAWCAWRVRVLACLLAYVLGLLACLRAYMLTCLMCLRDRAFGTFTCVHLHVFSMLACFISLHAHMSWMFAVIKYLTCLPACVLLWHLLSYFLYIWRINFWKILIQNDFFIFREVFRTHLNMYEGVFCKNKLTGKRLYLFCKKAPLKIFHRVLSLFYLYCY